MMKRCLIGVRQQADGGFLPVFAKAEDALSHHRVVVSAHGKGPFLPAAYSASRCRLPAVRRLLDSRRDLLAARFVATEGLVEMGLRLRFEKPAEEQKPFTSGRDFLRRAGERSVASADSRRRIDNVVSAAGSLAGVVRWRVLSDEGCVLSAALAVKREVGAFVAEALEAMAGDGLIIETSGPWPLYSFGLSEMLAQEIAP